MQNLRSGPSLRQLILRERAGRLKGPLRRSCALDSPGALPLGRQLPERRREPFDFYRALPRIAMLISRDRATPRIYPLWPQVGVAFQPA